MFLICRKLVFQPTVIGENRKTVSINQYNLYYVIIREDVLRATFYAVRQIKKMLIQTIGEIHELDEIQDVGSCHCLPN